MMDHVTLGHFQATEAMKRRINMVLDSGRLSYGPASRRFEEDFRKYLGAEHAIVCNSGTSALVVALQALKEHYGWEDGDEIIVPALTFVATVNAILHTRLTPVLVDIDPSTYNLCASRIPPYLTDRTRCILPVHLFGYPVDMDALEAFGLVLLEDCCEAFGSIYKREYVGTYGDIGCFSTYVGHHLVTGVGGMCVTDNPLLAQRMRSLVNHGIDVSELPIGEPYEPSHLGRAFRFVSVGHSFRMTELEAAIGISQLELAHWRSMKRAQNVVALSEMLRDVPNLQRPCSPDGTFSASYMMYPLVCKDEYAARVMDHLRWRGIECRTMMPLTNQPCYTFDEDAYPNAKFVNSHGFYVGCHEALQEEDLTRISRALHEYFGVSY